MPCIELRTPVVRRSLGAHGVTNPASRRTHGPMIHNMGLTPDSSRLQFVWSDEQDAWIHRYSRVDTRKLFVREFGARVAHPVLQDGQQPVNPLRTDLIPPILQVNNDCHVCYVPRRGWDARKRHSANKIQPRLSTRLGSRDQSVKHLDHDTNNGQLSLRGLVGAKCGHDSARIGQFAAELWTRPVIDAQKTSLQRRGLTFHRPQHNSHIRVHVLPFWLSRPTERSWSQRRIGVHHTHLTCSDISMLAVSRCSLRCARARARNGGVLAQLGRVPTSAVVSIPAAAGRRAPFSSTSASLARQLPRAQSTASSSALKAVGGPRAIAGLFALGGVAYIAYEMMESGRSLDSILDDLKNMLTSSLDEHTDPKP